MKTTNDADHLVTSEAQPPPPRSRRSAAIATFVGSGANTAVVSIQAVVLIPICLHVVGPRLFGAWLASGDLLSWIQIFDLGVPNLLIQRVGTAVGSGDLALAGRWAGTGTLVIGLVSVLMTTCGVVASFFLGRIFHLEGNEADTLQRCFALASLAAGAALFNNAFQGLARALQDTLLMNVVTLLASVLGLVVAITAIHQGYGLISVVFGLLSRATLALMGGIWFAVTRVPKELRRELHYDRAIMREYLAAMPATGAGGIAYAFMSQSETSLVAAVIGPEQALIYNLTKKASDLAESVVDMIAFATYGGFAHMIGARAPSADVRRVYFEIRAIRLVVMLAAMAGYVAVNRSLVQVWVGNEYGGLLLTMLFATQLVATGDSYLVNYLYRAFGQVVRGSWILVAESAIRVPLMLVGLLVFGMPGVPVAGILVSVPFAWMVDRALLRRLEAPDRGRRERRLGRTYVLGALMALLCAVTIGPLVVGRWVATVATGSVIFVVAGGVLFATSPHLAAWRQALARRLGRSPRETV